MLIEGLSEDESKMVLDKYKKRYAAVLKSNPDFIKKYPNPDKVIYGMAIKEITKLREKLGKNSDVGDYIDDFRKSDAKQFQGKSKKKRDQMAKAAFLNKEEQALEEIDNLMNETGQKISKKNMDDYKRLNELVKAALMGPINETLDDKVYDLVDRMLDAMGGSGNLLKELIRAMSTDDAMFYLSAIARDYDILDDAEEISEKKKDHDGDGDIDSDDYMIARDKAIKKAKGKKVDEAEVNEMKMMDFAKLAKKVQDSKEFIEKVASQLGSQSPEGEKALTSMYNSLKTMEESKEETLSERILKELRK